MNNNPLNNDPITEFLNATELTVREFAELSLVSDQVVRRAAQGLFGKLPPSLSAVMRNYYPDRDWDRDYDTFLWDFDTNLVLPDRGTATSFRDWRFKISSNLLEFCRRLRIQPVIISNYENGRTQDLPLILVAKLNKVTTVEYIEWLKGLPHHD